MHTATLEGLKYLLQNNVAGIERGSRKFTVQNNAQLLKTIALGSVKTNSSHSANLSDASQV
jgi:hypothetical protein